MAYSSVCLFGPPGAGKGTVGKLVAERLAPKFHYIATGDIVRAERDKGSGLYAILRSYHQSGRLVPDELICTMLFGHLVSEKINIEQLLLLDGIPRTQTQALLLRGSIDVRLICEFTDVPDETLMARIEGRARQEETAGRQRRDDDKPASVAKRLQEYREITLPTLESYKGQPISRIDASKSVEEVVEQVAQAISAIRI